MTIHIVTNLKLIDQFKKSRYFRKNLGLVSTVEKNGRRTPNKNDLFSFYYNNLYKTTIYGQGNVGNIKFYTDHYIKDDVFGVYYGENHEEFVFDFDFNYLNEKNMDAYLGKILKEVEERYEEKIKNDELKKLEEKPEGNPNKIFKNPGNVNYEDLKEYLNKKRKEKEI